MSSLQLLKRKIKTPNVKPEDLLPGDRNAIILFLRTSSYGTNYTVQVTDPRNNTTFKTVVDLTKLKYKELKETDLTEENIYITLNTFFKPYRRLECIKELNFVYIDLDYYKTKYTKEQVIMNLESNYFNKIIPATNYIIDSGRGLALLWNINKVPSQALPLWKAIQEYLYHQLKEFGADRQALDATRVLRVPGSINSKSKTTLPSLISCDALVSSFPLIIEGISGFGVSLIALSVKYTNVANSP